MDRKGINKKLILLSLLLFTFYIVYANVTSVYIATPVNHTNSTTGNMSFICNATPTANTNITNVTLYIWKNGANYTVYNTSSNTSVGANGTTVTRNFTITNIPEMDGYNYTWGCLASNGTNTNWSITNNTFRVDLTVPRVSLISPADNALDTTGSTTFVYNVSDNASNILNCTFYLNSTANQTNLSITKGINYNFTLENNPVGDILYWFVGCYDSMGRQGNSTTFTLDTIYNVESHSGGGGGGYNGVEYDEGQLTSSGISRSLKVKDTMKFGYLDEDHTLKLMSKTSSKVRVTLSSTPVTIDVNLAETKIVDLDGDGTNDITVTLDDLDASKATITVNQYTAPVEAITVETPEDITIEEEPESTNQAVPKQNTPEKAPEKTNYTWLVVALVVVIAIIAGFLIKKKK